MGSLKTHHQRLRSAAWLRTRTSVESIQPARDGGLGALVVGADLETLVDVVRETRTSTQAQGRG